jgi:hypothetical protein
MTNKVYCRRFAPRRRRGAARAAYGFVMVLLTVVAATPAPAQTLTVLYTFTTKADGFIPTHLC